MVGLQLDLYLPEEDEETIPGNKNNEGRGKLSGCFYSMVSHPSLAENKRFQMPAGSPDSNWPQRWGIRFSHAASPHNAR